MNHFPWLCEITRGIQRVSIGRNFSDLSVSDLLTHYIGPYHHLNKKMVRWGKSPTVLKKPLKKKKLLVTMQLSLVVSPNQPLHFVGLKSDQTRMFFRAVFLRNTNLFSLHYTYIYIYYNSLHMFTSSQIKNA